LTSRARGAESQRVKRPKKLDTAELERALSALPGWLLRAQKLHCELRFDSFEQAFAFMTSMALVSAEMNHHPEWSNVYTRVVIDLTTHDAGGVTELDVQWATRANALL
jgi:4a-hydroxytetrahydrobiopterin dehydratase